MKFIDDTLRALKALDENTLLHTGTYDGELPDRKELIALIKDVQSLMFPRFYKSAEKVDDEAALFVVYRRLLKQINCACRFTGEGCSCTPQKVTEIFISKLPEIKRLLLLDIEALYEGDPAAKFRDEVLLCYPGFYAISIYRMAHVLYELSVPLIPRMLTEYAHEKTGIDIHAGAKIGQYFFIDHGTGIVIGETTVIGEHVKLYQGVTLGAKSFELDSEGKPVKGIKRHPNIGNHVIIYANATILGGDTTIGDDCVIGANTWLISSVGAGETLYYTNGDE